MFEIKPIESKEEQEKFCRACGVEFRKNDMAYGATEGEKILGVCQFCLGDGEGYIHDLRCADGVEDFEAMFIMGRQTLNFIDLCGARRAVFCGEESRLSKAVGFKNENGKLAVDLNGFFTNPCSRKN